MIRRALATILLSAWAFSAHAAATIDVKGAIQVQAASGVTSFAYTGLTTTAASQTNGGILVFTEFYADPGTVTCVWDSAGANQTMTQIASVNSGPTYTNSYSRAFALLAPTSYGAKTISCSWTNTTFIGINAVSFTSINQTSVAAAFVASTAAPSAVTTSSITVNGAAADILMAFHSAGGSSPTLSAVNNTSWYIDNSLGREGSGASYTTGVTSAALTATWSFAYDIAVIGVDVVAYGGGGGGGRPPTMTLMGVD